MRKYVVFVVLCLALLLSSMSTYSVSVALPVLLTELNTSLVIAGWILSAYTLVYTVSMPLTGKISEAFGQRNTFVAYMLLFTLGSALSAIAPNVYVLIAARAIQALGGGGFMPCAAAVVSEEFPEARQRYIGFLSSAFPIGIIIGPNLGAWLIEAMGWRYVFWFNVPLGIIILALCAWMLPAGKKKAPGTSNLDLVGSGLLFGALFAIMFALTDLGNNVHHEPWAVIAALVLIGAGLVYWFLRWESRAKDPIISLSLMKERPFMASNLFNLFYGVSALGIRALVPLYAVSVYSMTTFQSGIVLVPWSVAIFVATTIASIYIVKWGYRWPILIGTLLTALGLLLLALQPGNNSTPGFHPGVTTELLVISGLCGLGTGITTPGANNACIELMPDKVATITGIRGMFRQVGNTFGVTIATVLVHMIGEVHRAFFVVMVAASVILLIAIPSIFIMPASPNVGVYRKKLVPEESR
jgi:EmrB/QacA subfamily drug resistance transporter